MIPFSKRSRKTVQRVKSNAHTQRESNKQNKEKQNYNYTKNIFFFTVDALRLLISFFFGFVLDESLFFSFRIFRVRLFTSTIHSVFRRVSFIYWREYKASEKLLPKKISQINSHNKNIFDALFFLVYAAGSDWPTVCNVYTTSHKKTPRSATSIRNDWIVPFTSVVTGFCFRGQHKIYEIIIQMK